MSLLQMDSYIAVREKTPPTSEEEMFIEEYTTNKAGSLELPPNTFVRKLVLLDTCFIGNSSSRHIWERLSVLEINPINKEHLVASLVPLLSSLERLIFSTGFSSRKPLYFKAWPEKDIVFMGPSECHMGGGLGRITIKKGGDFSFETSPKEVVSEGETTCKFFHKMKC